jgi:hypothetical protein
MDAALAQSLLIITGSMGSGKTVLLGEASDILTARGIPHVAIDLDMLGMAHLPVIAENNDVMYRNLKCVWHNYAEHGVDRLLIARAVEDYHELDHCLAAVAAKEVVLCRLTASLETMQRRVAAREQGICRDKYIDRVATLNAALDQALLENFVVSSEGRSITDVAMEVLQHARWL